MIAMPSVDVPVKNLAWRGVVDLEEHDTGVQPWRLPLKDRDLFHPDLVDKAACPSGVRYARSHAS